MDRVRSLIGNRRGRGHNRQHPPYPHSGSPSTVNLLGANGYGDDQSTIFARENESLETSANEGDDSADAATLNTAVSEGSTIGDLQRQGYVNRAQDSRQKEPCHSFRCYYNEGFLHSPVKNLSSYFYTTRGSSITLIQRRV